MAWSADRWFVLASVLSLTLLSAACGPVTYTIDMGSAERTVAAARSGNAAYFAPYELAFAEAHLAKAREEAAEGQYEDAIDMAAVAEAYGKRAFDLSTHQSAVER